MPTPEQRPEIKYKGKGRPHLETVNGLTEPAARLLGMNASNLTKYIQHHPRCQEAQRQARARMGDFTESKAFELIGEKHWPAIQYYLSTQCKDRGYVLPKGTTLGGDTMNNVVIGSVVVVPIKSGEFVSGPDADGANEILDGVTVEKLN